MLALRRGPLVLSCLESGFEHRPGGVPFEEAVQALNSVREFFGSKPVDNTVDMLFIRCDVGVSNLYDHPCTGANRKWTLNV